MNVIENGALNGGYGEGVGGAAGHPNGTGVGTDVGVGATGLGDGEPEQPYVMESSRRAINATIVPADALVRERAG